MKNSVRKKFGRKCKCGHTRFRTVEKRKKFACRKCGAGKTNKINLKAL